ncbi:MAG: type II toxin-antitoxin system VapC family toxin [Candidatus Bilamarchaeaceae archaeon]
MEKICLDYYAALDFLRGEPSTVEKLNYYLKTDEICISSITLAHLLFTIKKQDVVVSFANSITVIPIDRKVAVVASKLKNELEESGVIAPQEVLFNAAACIVNDAFLFTRKPTDYEKIKGLRRV